MFGNKKKDTEQKKSIIPSAPSHSLNTLVKGTIVEGIVKSESDIRVDGTIKGSLTCNAKVIVGPAGFIEGDIKCENAVVEGRITGNIQVAELLYVRETAEISGDVKTNKLTVQSGAIFNVTCEMGVQASGNGAYSNVKASKNVVKSAGKQKVGV